MAGQSTLNIAALSEDNSFGPLLAQCKSGPKYNVPVPTKDLETARSEFEFCARCAANFPDVALYLVPFGLTDWFMANAPKEPIKGDLAAAVAYLDKALVLLRAQVSNIGTKEINAIVHASVTKYAGQFNGKLIHTSVEDTALFAPKKNTTQPHLSSRLLHIKGIQLPLDQKQCDLTGCFQRLTKIVENDALVAKSGFPLPLQKTIQQAFDKAISDLQTQEPARVDHRLRQILMPTGTDYVALSPLATGSIGVLLYDAKMNQTVPSEEPEDDAPRKYLQTIGFMVGGANPRNASAHWTHRSLQNPLYFKAPQKDRNLHSVWSFIYRSWQPWVSKSMLHLLGEQLRTMSSSLDNSSTLTAVSIQETKTLFSLVMSCHEQAQDLSERLSIQTIDADGEERPIDVDLVSNFRGRPLSELDICLIEQRTGVDYQRAMSACLVETLWRLLDKTPNYAGTLSAQSNRQRLEKAIFNSLGKL